MFIRRKTYDELVEQKNDFERIAINAVAQNGRLLDEWHNAIEEMESFQESNHRLQQHNEELVAHCQRLEETARRAVSERDEMIDECLAMKAQLDLITKQRDYYYDLLENSSAFVEGEAISREIE